MQSASNSSDTKPMRINLRTSIQDKAVIEQAAQLRGVKVSEFILRGAVKRANSILKEEGVMILTSSDQRAFVNSFLEQHDASTYLTNAIKQYNEQ